MTLTLHINFLAVLACAIAAFLLGGFWYSPAGFGNIWKQEEGIGNIAEKKSHGALIFINFFAWALLAALALAIIVGPAPSISSAIIVSLLIGGLCVSGSFSLNYAFAGRSMKLFLIDAGYHTLQFVIYGVILGLWH